jgi:asparagine synthetase B (glutamine-hydrolysing)
MKPGSTFHPRRSGKRAAQHYGIDGGTQPIGNEDGTLWIVFNEAFNYIELKAELVQKDTFSQTDTEVVHL